MIPLLLSLAAVASLPVRSVELPADASRPILVRCPKDQTTRIVLPERVSRLTASAGAKESLGLAVEQYSPFGILAVQPASHPVSGRVVVRGPTRTLVLQLESSASGVASEVRFTLAAPAPPPIAASPAPAELPAGEPDLRAATPLGQASPGPNGEVEQQEPETPSEEAAATAASAMGEAPSERASLDLEGLLAARPVSIGRREGLPGQKQVVLVDALQGDTWVWFRFVVRGVVRLGHEVSGRDGRRRMLTGSVGQVREDLATLRDQGVTEVFIDPNFSPDVVSADADPIRSLDTALGLLEEFAPARGDLA